MVGCEVERAEACGPAAQHRLGAVGEGPLDEPVHPVRSGRGGSAGRSASPVAGVADRESPGGEPSTRANSSSATSACTSRRVPARHTCPALTNWPAMVRAAASRSASAKTRKGDLPPSSKLTGVRLGARRRRSSRAVARRAGEADAVDARVGDEGGAGDLADAMDDVEHAGRDAHVGGDLTEQ